MKLPRRVRSAHVVALAGCLILVACAEEESGPQFASDPVATRPLAESPVAATPAPLPTVRPAATPASISDLLRARGAPGSVFLTSGATVWSVTSDGQATRVFDAPEGALILAIDQSPGAEQAAVLLESGAAEERQSAVVIVDAAGEITARVEDFGGAAATPVRQASGGANVVDWSPQGDRVLVSPRGESIATLSLADGEEPMRFDAVAPGAVIVAPTWSPTGEAIAFIASNDAERQRSLRVIETGNGTVSDVVEPSDGRLVVEFAWMPDGASLLFTEGGNLEGAVSGIDLWRVDADGGDRQLVTSAGTVAPVAQITRIRPSPDGRSVAYTVLVPGADGPEVDSVWVRDLRSRVGFRIALPSLGSVDDIWWTDEGLVMLVTTRSTSERPLPSQALLRVALDGAVSALWAAPVPAATPAAASPEATPMGR